MTMVFPSKVADAAGTDAQATSRNVHLAMMGMVIPTLIQAWGRRGIDSGRTAE